MKFSMSSYAEDPLLLKRVLQFIDTIFPGIESIACSGLNYHARWDEISLPFLIEDQDELIAHLGLISFDMMLAGTQKKIAALHAICVQPDYRRKGFFKQLMQEAMSYIENRFDAAILFTDQPHLYEPFQFTVFPEFDFSVEHVNLKKVNSDFRLVSLDRDLKLIRDLFKNRELLSKKMDVLNGFIPFVYDQLNRCLFYSESLNALISYEVKEDALILRNIVSEKLPRLSEVIARVPESFHKVVLQFSPDRFSEYTYTPVLAAPECLMMISKSFAVDENYMRFPESYRC